ncbi:(4Fe-4S)-binding protein [Tamlana fucoidanivorans]|uniref:(4Fe-4S)-binding protein n=1 Tax=Allotamlana fucoidanivorans TaxID=2583814 RepID=A0A5C4SK63_9FLAO|nr:(4Fe-4S)-binding protein [Tamlana fucoidanivorans]TNJ43549.1 (4Fe-4S)-binding protein [Tamlana fucoidanivorans]
MEINSREFRNKEITVTYNPVLCCLSGICAKELSSVFRNSVIPWVDIDGATNEKIMSQVKKCPSGALQCFRNKKKVA